MHLARPFFENPSRRGECLPPLSYGTMKGFRKNRNDFKTELRNSQLPWSPKLVPVVINIFRMS